MVTSASAATVIAASAASGVPRRLTEVSALDARRSRAMANSTRVAIIISGLMMPTSDTIDRSVMSRAAREPNTTTAASAAGRPDDPSWPIGNTAMNARFTAT